MQVSIAGRASGGVGTELALMAPRCLMCACSQAHSALAPPAPASALREAPGCVLAVLGSPEPWWGQLGMSLCSPEIIRDTVRGPRHYKPTSHLEALGGLT